MPCVPDDRAVAMRMSGVRILRDLAASRESSSDTATRIRNGETGQTSVLSRHRYRIPVLYPIVDLGNRKQAEAKAREVALAEIGQPKQ